MYHNYYLEKCIDNNDGSPYLIWGYERTKRDNFNELVIDDLGFIYNDKGILIQFKNEMVKSGIKEFVLINHSSGLMDILHALDSVGIRIEGIAEVSYISKFTNEKEYLKGLKMIVIV